MANVPIHRHKNLVLGQSPIGYSSDSTSVSASYYGVNPYQFSGGYSGPSLLNDDYRIAQEMWSAQYAREGAEREAYNLRLQDTLRGPMQQPPRMEVSGASYARAVEKTSVGWLDEQVKETCAEAFKGVVC